MPASLSATTPAKAAKRPLLARSLMPLVAISLAGMLGAGAVVAIAGGISAIWPPFLLLVFGPLLFPLLLVPAGLMAGLWNIMQKNKHWFVRVFAAGSIAWLAALLAFTMAMVAWLSTGMPRAVAPGFVWMFVICAGVAPWAVFTLRDRGNLLMVMMLWMQVASALLLLPLLLAGVIGFSGYGFFIWLLMLAMLGVQNIRENARAAAARPPVADTTARPPVADTAAAAGENTPPQA